MANECRNNHLYRGFFQSDDGIISRVLKSNSRKITFQTTFGLNSSLVKILKDQPEHVFFSERSRIARLGIQIECDAPSVENLEKDRVTLTLEATPVIPGYPKLGVLREFFTLGLPVGRLVFCRTPGKFIFQDVIFCFGALLLGVLLNISKHPGLFIVKGVL